MPAPTGAAIHLLPEEGRAAGMPAIGFTLRDVWQGFARSMKPEAGTYLSLGGPPGGTLMFVVKSYQNAEPSHAALERLFADWTRGVPGMEPVVKGPKENLQLAGASRPAMAFVIGRSMATSNYCTAMVPSRSNPREGLYVLMGVGTAEGATPSCERSTTNERLAPLVAGLSLD